MIEPSITGRPTDPGYADRKRRYLGIMHTLEMGKHQAAMVTSSENKGLTDLGDTNKYLNDESQLWLARTTKEFEELPDKYESHPPENRDWHEMEKLLDNRTLQNHDLIGACTRLGVTNKLCIQLPNMRINAKLNSFQLAGIDRIMTLWKNGPKITILNDIVGCGKTWQYFGVVLAVSINNYIKKTSLIYPSESMRTRKEIRGFDVQRW